MRALGTMLTVGVVGVVISCGLPDEPLSTSGKGVINGRYCDEAIFPSAAAVMFDATMIANGREFPITTVMCTATLIAPDVVLTAAHCLDISLLTGGDPGVFFKDKKYYITFKPDLALFTDPARQDPGAKLLPIPEDAIPVKRGIQYENFQAEKLRSQTFKMGVNDSLNDVALLFLDRALSVKPAIVITKEEANQIVEGKSVWIAGWGQQAPSDPRLPPTPGSVGRKYCGETTIGEVGPTEMQIGNGSESARKCHGDSGGPSYMKVEGPHSNSERVVGITSHAYNISDCFTGGVDTRVDAWLDWLDTTMKAACADGTRSWCEVKGLIPPSYYDPPGTKDAGGEGAGDGGTVTKPKSGCAFNGAPSADGFFLLGLLGLAWAAGRRRSKRRD